MYKSNKIWQSYPLLVRVTKKAKTVYNNVERKKVCH